MPLRRLKESLGEAVGFFSLVIPRLGVLKSSGVVVRVGSDKKCNKEPRDRYHSDSHRPPNKKHCDEVNREIYLYYSNNRRGILQSYQRVHKSITGFIN